MSREPLSGIAATGQAGFTLMELLVAMALASIVGLAVYSLSSSVMGAYDQVRKVRRQDFGFVMLSEVVREDLRSVFPGMLTHEDFSFYGESYGEGNSEPFMRFATSATLDLSTRPEQYGGYQVRYSLEDEEGSGLLNFVREERKYIGLETEPQWQKVIVAKNIVAFSVEYADPETKYWEMEWSTPAKASRGGWVPYGVRMSVTFASAAEVPKVIQVLLPQSVFMHKQTSF